MKHVDVLVRGAGIVGQSLALSLARLGLQVGLRPDEPRAKADPATPDVRAYALNASSVALLKSLKVWDALPAHAATPVYDMHVQGDAEGAAIAFSAWEQRSGELAWIVDAPVLERELGAALRFSPHVHRLSAAQADHVKADLVALCEGKASATRAALGVRFERHDYGHSAIAARLVASTPHQGTARQWFRSPDVLALLPFDAPEPQRSYALVWSLPRERCAELMALNEDDFAAALMAATRGEAGDLLLASARAEWPLAIAQASAWSGPGWVLLGDAAHLVHPLAGQGLNLGLADVVALTRVIESREPWRPLSDEKLLRRYVRARALPTWAMGRVTDGLLQIFSHEAPAARELRNRGLGLVNRLTPIKRWLTARALDS
ncbi:FAD-dependent monooxygenase [Piscinibacter sp.]|uniref:FAD-dependent monooxygenase n=1 Tax=Piscinibacter sp. TaxID=1903157 RepID=UPI001B4DEC97|nr:FAD-dependent monooxygenase [Piscinibacter sp.]MBP5988432.1 FAD-dependent monooxygenase [Piscinibacter sp.]MBP6026080.1 FAD-dependent monooxygenase [Piscinibacter sp.]